jgi:hypothetical protein
MPLDNQIPRIKKVRVAKHLVKSLCPPHLLTAMQATTARLYSCCSSCHTSAHTNMHYRCVT